MYILVYRLSVHIALKYPPLLSGACCAVAGPSPGPTEGVRHHVGL